MKSGLPSVSLEELDDVYTTITPVYVCVRNASFAITWISLQSIVNVTTRLQCTGFCTRTYFCYILLLCEYLL